MPRNYVPHIAASTQNQSPFNDLSTSIKAAPYDPSEQAATAPKTTRPHSRAPLRHRHRFNLMELDPRLQDLTSDLHDYQFAPTSGFDNGYSAAIYHGLTEEHGIAPHPQAQYVQDGAEAYFGVNTRPQPAQAQSQRRRINVQRTSQTPRQQGHIHNVNPTAGLTINTSNLVNNGTLNGQGQYGIHNAQQSQQHIPQTQYATHYTAQSPIQHTPSFTRHSTTGLQVNTPITPSTTHQSTRNKIPDSSAHTQAYAYPTPTTSSTGKDLTTFTPPSAFPLVADPPDLTEWRQKFFNITSPILLTSKQYHTYFPHVDNIYSHRSTQKYKRKPFVSHYWDCRLKGRPTGTPLSKSKNDKSNTNASVEALELDAEVEAEADGNREKKKRKRKTRERDLCDVKIKVTEFFGRDELEASGRLPGEDDDGLGSSSINGQLTFVHEDGTTNARDAAMANSSDLNNSFGVLEPPKQFPDGHPGAEGKRWYMVQRVNGTGKDGEDTDEQNLDHKHSLEESDRIKKNSVQRWLLAQEKQKKKQTPRNKNMTTPLDANDPKPRRSSTSSITSYTASGEAKQTVKAHATPAPTRLTLYGSSFCPFAQRIWIALELKRIPYQYVEVLPPNYKDGKCSIPNLLEFCPEGIVPCIVHGNFAVWESDVMLEYLEDLAIGQHRLLPLGNPQLRAHCRMWADHINRKILPLFYALLLLPIADGTLISNANADSESSFTEQRAILINSLQEAITLLVNASHATGPFFLGTDMSFVDVEFAPFIIRLFRVLSFYREFPRPEVGTRWGLWVDAIERDEFVKSTVSDERSYHNVYGGIGGEDDYSRNLANCSKRIAEMGYAQRIIRTEGFGLGGDLIDRLRADPSRAPVH